MKCVFCAERVLEPTYLQLLAAIVVEPKEAIAFICKKCEQELVMRLNVPATHEIEDVEIGGMKFKARKE